MNAMKRLQELARKARERNDPPRPVPLVFDFKDDYGKTVKQRLPYRVHPLSESAMYEQFRIYHKHQKLKDFHHPTMGTMFQAYHRRMIELMEQEFPRFKEVYEKQNES